MPEYNLNAPVETVVQQRLKNQQFLQGQNQLTSDFLTKFGGAIAGQGTTQAAAERIGGELGLPQLRQNAFNLQQQLIDIPSVYKEGTRGFDVNANQLARIVNARTAELGPLAQRATAQAQFGEQELGTRLGYLQNDWKRELDAILDKVRNGITLSEGEKNRANQLAIAEKGYENQLKQIAEQAKYKGQESPYMTVGEGSTVFDPITGRIIYKAPKTYQARGNDPLGLF